MKLFFQLTIEHFSCFASKSSSRTNTNKLDAILNCMNNDARKHRKITQSQIDELFVALQTNATLTIEQSTVAVKCLGMHEYE